MSKTLSLKITQNWTILKLEDIGQWGSGGTPKKGIAEYYGGDIPWLKIGDLNDGLVEEAEERITELGLRASSAKLLTPGVLLIAMYGSIGKLGITGIHCATNQAIAFCYPDVDLINLKYLFWLLRNSRSELTAAGKGGTQQNISQTVLKAFEIPLPPLNEQRRIVAKIEALKARSQQVKEALEAIPPLLDQFRQSVLAAAFRGDLTADWREKNLDVDWETTTLEQVIKSKPRNGYSPKPVDYPTQVKSITLSATTSGKFKPEYFKYIDEVISIDSHLWLTPGDILIQRSNTLDYVGTCAIYDGAFGEVIYPDLIMKFQVREEKAIPKFIYYALSTTKSRQYFRNNATGTAGNMPKINQKVVMNTPIYLPTIEEQKEIVCRIESFLKAADTIAQQYREVKAHLELLDQSILAKAFRGELVPQDPNDEPASVLLERIRAERAKREAAVKGAKKSTGKTTGQRRRKAQQQDSESVQLELPGLE